MSEEINVIFRCVLHDEIKRCSCEMFADLCYYKIANVNISQIKCVKWVALMVIIFYILYNSVRKENEELLHQIFQDCAGVFISNGWKMHSVNLSPLFASKQYNFGHIYWTQFSQLHKRIVKSIASLMYMQLTPAVDSSGQRVAVEMQASVINPPCPAIIGFP